MGKRLSMQHESESQWDNAYKDPVLQFLASLLSRRAGSVPMRVCQVGMVFRT